MKKLVILSIFFLCGCSSNSNKEESPIDNRQSIPDCVELPDFEGKSFGDLYQYTIKNFELYNICSNKVKLLKSL